MKSPVLKKEIIPPGLVDLGRMKLLSETNQGLVFDYKLNSISIPLKQMLNYFEHSKNCWGNIFVKIFIKWDEYRKNSFDNIYAGKKYMFKCNDHFYLEYRYDSKGVKMDELDECTKLNCHQMYQDRTIGEILQQDIDTFTISQMRLVNVKLNTPTRSSNKVDVVLVVDGIRPEYETFII